MPVDAVSAALVGRPTPRSAGLIAGVALLLIAALGGFANFVVVEGLVTSGDGSRTAADIAGSETLFRLGVGTLYLAALLDIVVAWALMRVFSVVSPELSRLEAWLRLAYAAVFMAAIGHLAAIPRLLSGADEATGLTTDQVHAEVLAKVTTFHDLWFAGLVLFGAHLAVAGYLVFRSGFAPRWLGVLLAVAGAGYLADSFLAVFIDEPPVLVSTFTFVGEFLLAVWLVTRSRRIPEMGADHGV